MVASIPLDVRTIVSDDASLQTGILPALESYNVAQFITVDVPGQSHQVKKLLFCIRFLFDILTRASE